jgi:hypothetical protein
MIRESLSKKIRHYLGTDTKHPLLIDKLRIKIFGEKPFPCHLISFHFSLLAPKTVFLGPEADGQTVEEQILQTYLRINSQQKNVFYLFADFDVVRDPLFFSSEFISIRNGRRRSVPDDRVADGLRFVDHVFESIAEKEDNSGGHVCLANTAASKSFRTTFQTRSLPGM